MSALGSWDDVDDSANDPADPAVGAGGEPPAQTSEEVDQVLAWLGTAEEAATSAAERLTAAQDALADAVGAVRVAEARHDDLEQDSGQLPWQHVEAAEAVATADRARRRAAERVTHREEALEARLAAAAAARADLDAARAAAQTPEAGEPGEANPALYFGSVDDFVREFIVPTFRRKVGDRGSFRWAADWWRYPEAVVRLEALWRSWEFLRLDPATGMSVWLRDHADPHLAVLFCDYGPFAKSEDSSQLGEPLPYKAPPPGLYPDVRTQS